MRTMKTTCLMLALLAALATTGPASAQDAAQTQIGGVNIQGYGEAGVRFFGEEPSKSRQAKFLEYRDINQGLYLQELRLRFFTSDESYSGEFGGRQWGLQDQEFHLLAERLGKWQAGFDWDQMRHIYSTNARTLAVQGPRGVFTLPGRPPLSTYNSAPELDEISVRWDTAHMYFKLSPTPDLDLIAEYTRIRKDGERPMGIAFGSPGNNFAEFLQPIEQIIHDFRLGGTWAKEQWQLQFDYVLSVFENDVPRFRADNPCGAAAVAGCGADAGAAAPVTGQTVLPPNNMAHTINLAGGVNLPMRTRVNASFRYSLWLQNDDFFPHTINPNVIALNSPDLVLPQKSLHGNVQIAQFSVGATSRPLPVPVVFNLKYRYFDLMDFSDAPIFPGHVVNDRGPVVSQGRKAGRFDFTRQNGDLDERWQIIQPVALTLGGAWERWDRNEHREVPESDEFFAKAALDITPWDWLLVRATYLPSFRRINKYETRAHAEHVVVEDAAAAAAGQSTLLRKFDEAERDRQRADLLVQIMPLETLTFTPVMGYRADDYINSKLGIKHAITWSAGADLTWAPVQRVSFTTGFMHESIWQKMESRSRPVNAPSTVVDVVDFDWFSNTTDTVDTFHASATASLIPKKLDLKFGGAYSYALGRVENRNPVGPASGTLAQNNSAKANPFPAFEDSLLRIDAALRYHFAEVWTASLNYTFEAFRKHDWRTDTLNPFQPGVSSIFLGNDLKNYDAHIVGITVGYVFK